MAVPSHLWTCGGKKDTFLASRFSHGSGLAWVCSQGPWAFTVLWSSLEGLSFLTPSVWMEAQGLFSTVVLSWKANYVLMKFNIAYNHLMFCSFRIHDTFNTSPWSITLIQNFWGHAFLQLISKHIIGSDFHFLKILYIFFCILRFCLFLFHVYKCLSACTLVYHVHAIPTETRRGCQESLDLVF